MTLGAGYRFVLSGEREGGLRVPVAIEARWFEPVFGVAGGAVRPRNARYELPAVGIFMTVLAAVVRQRPMEIRTLVARRAGECCVLSPQCEFRGVVIEARTWTAVLPSAGIVAAFASFVRTYFLERSAMRIRMTILATGEHQRFEDPGPISRSGMTLLAEYALVPPGE